MKSGVIITAAGSSSRIGHSIKKEYFHINDKPVLKYSIEAFLKTDLFSFFIITVPAGDQEKVRVLLEEYFEQASFAIIPGGKTRQESVYNGLKAMESFLPEVILIHDGARPWITPLLIQQILNVTKEKGSCIPVIDSVNALVEVDEQGCLVKALDRSKIKGVQTPQGFNFNNILKAHFEAAKQGITAFDDSALYKWKFGQVCTTEGDPDNIKITYKKDLVK